MIKLSFSHRLVYFSAVILVIILGLASRRFSAYLPVFVSENAGDMLWAIMVYLGFRGLFLSKSLLFAAFVSFGFCYLIEFSQLYKTPWLNNLRHTVPGALVLGQGFLLVDLVRYTVGLLIIFWLDTWLAKSWKRKTNF